MDSIRVKRGLSKDLPQRLPLGELAFCTDTQELWVGTGSSTPLKKVKDSELEQNLEQTNAQLSKTPKYVCVDDYISKLPSDLETIERTTRGIENAISSLESGDTLFFESRNYTINRTLQPTVSNITILGKYSNVSFPKDLDGVVWKFEGLVNINIEGMVASNSTSAQTWIKARSTHHLHIYKCATDGMKLGFDLNDCYWTRIESVRMQSIYQA